MSKTERMIEIGGVLVILFAVLVIGITLGRAAGERSQKAKTDPTIIELQKNLDMVTRERDKFKHDAEAAEHALDVFQEAK